MSALSTWVVNAQLEYSNEQLDLDATVLLKERTMKRFRVSLVAAMLLMLGSIEAQAQDSKSVFVFETVDSFSFGYTYPFGFTVEGILQGEASATEINFDINTSNSFFNPLTRNCQQMALLMMSTPGKYRFSVTIDLNHYHEMARCKLSRVNP